MDTKGVWEDAEPRVIELVLIMVPGGVCRILKRRGKNIKNSDKTRESGQWIIQL